MRERHRFHPNHIDAFVSFASTLGYQPAPVKGDFEVLRLVNPTAPTLVYFQRMETKHITAYGDGLRLFNKFMATCH